MIGPEQEFLRKIVPRGRAFEHGLHCLVLGHIATSQEGERAQAERAAQDLAAVDLADQAQFSQSTL